MGKTHRGKGIRRLPARGRDTCLVCKRIGKKYSTNVTCRISARPRPASIAVANNMHVREKRVAGNYPGHHWIVAAQPKFVRRHEKI